MFPSFLLPITISFGFFMYFFVMLAISFGMVAEKSSMLRFSGTSARMALILSVNPMFSISSASSMMTFSTKAPNLMARKISGSRSSVRSMHLA